MAKTVPESKFQEWEGLDRIQIIVHKMRCIYRELNKDDFGIDGEIELVISKPDGLGFETTGNIIKFQAKSGKSYIKSDNSVNFSVPVDKNDLQLWYKSNVPTLFIIYHPKDDCLYWKEVKSYIKQTRDVWKPPFHIEFQKTLDEFTENCFERIAPIANVKQSKILFSKKEKLFSNLLELESLPPVWSSSTNVEDEDEIYFSITNSLPPFFVNSQRLYTCVDLSNPTNPFSTWINSSDIRLEENAALCSNQDLKRGFVKILNMLLREHLELSKIQYLEVYKRYYFMREDTTHEEFKHSWFNIRNHRQAPGKTTVKKYEYGIDKFWRHLAASLNFKQIEDTWYLQIIPRYFFTNDGILPYDTSRVGALTTKIKAKEINHSVLYHVLFWADALSWAGSNSDKKLNIMISYDGKNMICMKKMPCFGIAPFSIPADPAIYREKQMSGQPSLIEWIEQPDKEEDDDED